ncbi:MAG: hypothetical protein WAK01_05335 [Methylocystis sp.]
MMLRRSFFKTLGFAALAGPAASRAAPTTPSSPHADLVELAGAAAQSAAAAREFLRFAMPRLGARDAALADCAASGAEMVAACDALTALAASDASFAFGFARTVADLCAAARKDCKKLPNIAECATLAAAAATCEAACRKAAG